jgi:hypothetical protein
MKAVCLDKQDFTPYNKFIPSPGQQDKEIVMSGKFSPRSLGVVIILGAVWGLSEAGLGLGLKACASLASGSIMTSVAFFFIAAAWSRARTMTALPLLVVITGGFKLFDASLLSLPVRSGAVANPLFAFVTEGLAFALLFTLGRAAWKSKPAGQAALGGLAAVSAVAVFPLVKLCTGIPACAMPGTTTPLAWHYAPLAVGLSLVTVPLGILVGKKLELRKAKLDLLVIPAAVAACAALMVLLRLV